MKLNRVEGHPGMINNKTVNAVQFQLLQDMIKANGGEPLISRKVMKSLHMELRGKKASPFFVAKNIAAKTKTAGMYDLSKLKLEGSKNSPSVKAENAKPKAEKKRTKREKTPTTLPAIEAPANGPVETEASTPETV
jgi:hypothetical protein